MNAQNVYATPACVGKEKMNRESVYKQLVIDEGVKYEIYKDHFGYATLAIGHQNTEYDEEKGHPLGNCIILGGLPLIVFKVL